jgi:hypothetical protein
VSTLAPLLGLITFGGFVLMWSCTTIRHRSHLSQCVFDLQRQRRLDRRLAGCVADVEQILDRLPASDSTGEIPEVLVGHVHYLYGIRREATDNVRRLSSHAVRLRWPDGYLSRATLAGKRCELAHGALVTAFQTLADAALEYERGIPAALQGSGDGADKRALTMPVRLLDEVAAQEVARLRDVCETALANTAAATGLRNQAFLALDATWPVRRSEAAVLAPNPYLGEIRPMGWKGLGPQPAIHVDAR